MFGDKFTKLTGLSLAAFVALIVGLQWDAFFKALAGFPALLQAWSSGLPFGAWSFLLALAIAMGVWGWVFMHPPTLRCFTKPHSCADSLTVGVGLAVMLSQQFAGGERGAGVILTTMWLGILAGLLAMYLARLLWSVFAPTKEPPA